MIQIDRVRTNVDVVSQPQGAPRPTAQAVSTMAFDQSSREQFRDFILDVLREHLRDLERRGIA